MNIDCKYESLKFRQKFFMWIAWRLPKPIVLWCSVRLIAHATTGEYSDEESPALNVVDALKRWETA